MTSKPNPAKQSCTISSDLSSLEEVDNHLNLLFKAKTGRPTKLSFNQLIQCLQLKRKYTCDTWLGLYRCLLDKRKSGEVSLNLPTYANFLKSIKKLTLFLFRLILYQTEINKQIFFKQQTKVAFVDSIPIPVCKIIRSSRHKTMNKIENDRFKPSYSKSTTGWFYGYKLHLTCNFETKEVLYFQFSNAKLDDRKYLEKIMKTSFLNSETMFVADKGYQAKWLEELAKETGNYLLTGKKKSKNMKVLASQFDIYLLHIRARIE